MAAWIGINVPLNGHDEPQTDHEEIISVEEQPLPRGKNPAGGRRDTVDLWPEGGQFTYCFGPTGIGTCVKVHHAAGEEIDLSEYERW